MSIDLHVNVSISLATMAVQRAGFGTPILLDYFPTTIFADYTRTYRASTGLTSLVDDGFATTDPIYLMAQALLGAQQKVEEFKVGRLDTAYTQNTKATTTSTTEGAIVGFDFIEPDGTEHACYHTVTAGQTAQQVAAAVKALVDATGAEVTIAAPTDANMNIIADNAGEIFYFHSASNCLLFDVTTDPGIATDLSAIVDEDDDFYGIACAINSFAITDAIAGWTETRRKIYCAQTQDSDVITSAETDICTELKDDARLRTYVIYQHPKQEAPLSEYPACAWIGVTFPKDAGSQTHAFKTLSGVTPCKYTANELTYLYNKNCNHYMRIAGVAVTRLGNMSIGQTTFVDEVRLRDWLQARIEENVFQLMISNDKIPYDDNGIDMIRGAIQSAYVAGARAGGLRLDSFNFTALPASEQDAADVALRIVRDIEFGGQFTSGIHKVYITGNVQ